MEKRQALPKGFHSTKMQYNHEVSAASGLNTPSPLSSVASSNADDNENNNTSRIAFIPRSETSQCQHSPPEVQRILELRYKNKVPHVITNRGAFVLHKTWEQNPGTIWFQCACGNRTRSFEYVAHHSKHCRKLLFACISAAQVEDYIKGPKIDLDTLNDEQLWDDGTIDDQWPSGTDSDYDEMAWRWNALPETLASPLTGILDDLQWKPQGYFDSLFGVKMTPTWDKNRIILNFVCLAATGFGIGYLLKANNWLEAVQALIPLIGGLAGLDLMAFLPVLQLAIVPTWSSQGPNAVKPWVPTLVAMVMSFIVAGTSGPSDMIKKKFWEAPNWRNFSIAYSTVGALIKGLFAFVWETLTGLPWFSDIDLLESDSDLTQIYNEVQAIQSERAFELIQSSVFACDRILNVEQALLNYKKSRTRRTLGDSVSSVVDDLSKKVSEWVKLVMNSGMARGRFRVPPLVVRFHGPSNAGKSAITPLFAAAVLSGKIQLPAGTNFSSQIYNRTTGNEFWGGYTNQACVVYDDFGQRTDTASAPCPDFMELINCANSAPFNVPMADVESKARTFFRSSLMILSSNIQAPAIKSVNCPEAVLRRIDLDVRVERGPVDLETRKRGEVDLDCYTFHVSPLLEGHTGCNRLPERPMTWNELVKLARTGYDRKTKAHEGHAKQVEDMFAGPPVGSLIPVSRQSSDEGYDTVDLLTPEPTVDEKNQAIADVADDFGEFMKADFPVPTCPTMIPLMTAPVAQSIGDVLFSEPKSWPSMPTVGSIESKASSYLESFMNMLSNGVGRISEMFSGTAPDYLVTVGWRRYKHLATLIEDGDLIVGEQEKKIFAEYAHQAPCYGCIHVKVSLPTSMIPHGQSPESYLTDLVSIENPVDPIHPGSDTRLRDDGDTSDVSIMKLTTTTSVMGDLFWLYVKRVKEVGSSMLGWIQSICDKVMNMPSAAKVRMASWFMVGILVGVANLAGQWWKQRPMEAFSESFAAKGEKKVAPVKGFYKAQGGDSVANESAIGFQKNIYPIFFENKTAGHFVILRDRTAVVPAHILNFLRAENAPFRTERRSVPLSFTLEELNPFFWHNDLALITLPHPFHKHRDIVNKFVTEEVITFNRGTVRLLQRNEQHHGFFNIDTRMVHYDDPTTDETHYLNHHVRYNIPTVSGDCGALVTHNVPSVAAKIMGLHVAGSGGMYGLGRIVTSTELESALEAYANPEIEGKDPEDLLESDKSIEAQGLAPSKLDPRFKILEEGRKEPNMPKKSKIRPSPLHGCFPKTKGLSILRPVGGVDPLIKGVNKYADAMQVDPKEWEPARQLVEQALMRPAEAKVLTIEEAIDSWENLEAIQLSKSAGLPWINQAKTTAKRSWITKDWVHPAVKAEIEAMIQAAQEGKRRTHVYLDCLKDERRALDKCDPMNPENIKTRVFAIAPMEIVILMRMYCGAFISSTIEHKIQNGLTAGINPQSIDWTLCVNHLWEAGANNFDGDWSGYDTRLPSSLIREVFWHIENWYRSFDPNWTEQDAKVREYIATEIAESRHQVGDKLIQWHGGLPSGCPGTNQIDSIANHIIFVRAMQHAGLSDTQIHREVRMLFHGDDNLFSVSDGVSLRFTPKDVAEYGKAVGMIYTAANKHDDIEGYKKLEDCQFLKRSFIGEGAFYWAPIDIEVPRDSIQWTKANESDTLSFPAALDSAIEEWVAIDTQESRNDLAKVLKRAREARLFPLVPRKEELKCRYLTAIRGPRGGERGQSPTPL